MPDQEDKNKAEEQPRDEDWDDWDDEEEEDDDEVGGFARMGFLDHLTELRDRLYRIIIALLLGIVICWNFVDFFWEIMEVPAKQMLQKSQERSFSITKKAENITISMPRFPDIPEGLDGGEELRTWLNLWRRDANAELQRQIRELMVSRDSKLMQTSITEAFFLKVKLSFLAGLILMYPFIVFQVWAFVAPGLYKKERRLALPFIIFATVFFLGGVSFAFYVAVPFAGTFLMGFGADFVQMITIDKYMDFLITMMLGLGIVFEIPMVIFLLAKLRIATPRWLIKNFRYALIVIVAVAALVTPTGDPVNLAVFSLPMILLYGLGIIIAWIWGPKDKNEDEDEDWDDDDPANDDYEEPDEDDEDDDEGRESYGDDDDEEGGGGGAAAGVPVAGAGSDDEEDDEEEEREYQYLRTSDSTDDRPAPRPRLLDELAKSGAVTEEEIKEFENQTSDESEEEPHEVQSTKKKPRGKSPEDKPDDSKE